MHAQNCMHATVTSPSAIVFLVYSCERWCAGDFTARQQAAGRAAAYAVAPAPAAAAAEVAVEAPPEQPASLADLLKNLPPMPAGWKPGDAIPGLPAAAAQPPAVAPVAVAPVHPSGAGDATAQISAERLVAAVQAAAPVEPAAPPPAPAPRPVSAAFNFALNPDMDLEFGGVDSDSDDSSEED